MRYLLYFFTMGLLFACGMLVGNVFLPPREASLASAVSVPPLNTENPIFQQITREVAQQDLEILNQALNACPLVVNEEKDRLLNQIKLRLALENFETKKLKLELEIAKNQETNRTTTEFTQASVEYTQAKQRAEKLADELFPFSATPEQADSGAAAPAEAAEPTATTKSPASTETAAADSAANK